MKIRWLLSVCALAGGLALFFTACEKRTVKLPMPRRGEAAENRYFAAIRLLQALGVETRSERDPSALAELPDADGTVFLLTARASVSAERSAELLDWALRGGHLVLVTYQLWDDEARQVDPLLDPFGFHQFENAVEPDEDDPDGIAGPVKGPPLSRVTLSGREQPLAVAYSGQFRFAPLERQPVLEIASDYGIHLLTVRHGAGFVTGMTDDLFMGTSEIDEFDHAELVYRLARFEGHDGSVLWIWGDDFPSVIKLFLRYAWMIAFALAALVAVWIAHAAPRFGPLARDPELDRRDLMEHVRAAGRFQWRYGAAAGLLADTRAALLVRVAQRHPAWLGLDPAPQAAQLAAVSGLETERVLDALGVTLNPALDRFVADVSILERIRRSL